MDNDNQANVLKIHFESKDSLPITADLYEIDNPKGTILLCHRSHFNRGEYEEVAPKLNELGFSCLAIDQRSGMNVYGFVNEASTLAKQKGLPTGYLDAKQDIEASVDYLYKKTHKKPIVLVGSSYSAALALLIGKSTNKVKAIAAFSPGEYLKGLDVAELIKGLTKPTYVTSAKKEIAEVSKIIRSIDAKYVTHFKPQAEGAHGSKALWSSVDGNEGYWESFNQFLLDQS